MRFATRSADITGRADDFKAFLREGLKSRKVVLELETSVARITITGTARAELLGVLCLSQRGLRARKAIFFSICETTGTACPPAAAGERKCSVRFLGLHRGFFVGVSSSLR